MNKSTKILTFFNKELRFFFLNDKIAKEIVKIAEVLI